MFSLIIGGSASGKSAYAERLAGKLAQGRPGIYLATMESAGSEAQARIARHRAMRRELGFSTVECARDLETVSVPPDSCVLLEDMGNLAANVLFGGTLPDSAGEAQAMEAVEEILRGVASLRARCAHLVIVSNEVFSGGSRYAGETDLYLQVLARVNREFAARADSVVEVVCGRPVPVSPGKNAILFNGSRSVIMDGFSEEKDYSRKDFSIRKDISLSRKREKEGENGMLFVTGPLASGKKEYVMRTFGWDEAAFTENAVENVQDLAAQIVREESLSAEKEQADRAETGPVEDRLRELADRLAQKHAVIATEVGGGIVPLDPVERREREAAGRLACMLAERAQTVVRVFCGLPQVLKA